MEAAAGGIRDLAGGWMLGATPHVRLEKRLTNLTWLSKLAVAR